MTTHPVAFETFQTNKRVDFIVALQKHSRDPLPLVGFSLWEPGISVEKVMATLSVAF